MRRAFADLVRGDVRLTTGPGDEARLTRDALAAGFTTLVVLGGDGTWSKVAGEIVASGADARLVPLAAGTGNDFPKSLGLPAGDLGRMAALAASGASRTIDVGTVEGRIFLNSVGFGFDVAALEVAARTRWLSGNALYVYAALNLLLRYRGVDAELHEAMPDAATPVAPRRYLGLVLANGARFGGSFIIAPEAVLDDGRLDAIEIGDAGAMRRIKLLNAVSRGTHTRGFEEVQARARDAMWVRFAYAPLYEIDGELHRARGTTVEVRCRPRALRVVAPATAA